MSPSPPRRMRPETARTLLHHIPPPDDFDFDTTVRSHGWCLLSPFVCEETGPLRRTLRVSGGVSRLVFDQPDGRGGPIRVRLEAGSGSRVGFDQRAWATVERAAVRMFQLDRDLDEFLGLAQRAGGSFAEAAKRGFGRLLRAPSLFEDVVKILATTNTTWGGTKAMVRNLVDLAGNRGTFPTPAEVAALGTGRLASEGRWGYRAAYLARLAEDVASGGLDLDEWEHWEGTTEELETETRRVPGLGPYAAAHVLMLLGRFDRIGVDTEFRSFVRQKYFPRARKPPSDRRMLGVYRDWGRWRGLAYWADLWLWHTDRK